MNREQQLTFLRVGFFLSRGSAFFSQKILALLPADQKHHWAEFIYYSAPEQIAEALNDFAGAEQNPNLKTAKDFYAGHLDIFTGDPRDLPNPAAINIQLLPARVENIPVFLRQAGRALEGREDHRGQIKDYLREASNAFVFELARQMLGNPRFTFPSLAIEVLNRADEGDEAHHELGLQLLNRSAHNWSQSGEFSNMRPLVARIDQLSPLTRDELLNQFLEHRNDLYLQIAYRSEAEKDLREMELTLYSWASPPYFEPHRQAYERHMGISGRAGLNKLHTEHRRWKAGFVSDSAILLLLNETLTQLRSRLEDAEGGGSQVLTHVLYTLSKKSPQLALEITRLLVQPQTLEILRIEISQDALAQISNAILRQIPERIALPLLQLMVKTWRGKTWQSGLVLSILGKGKDFAPEQTVMAQLLSGPQTDPETQNLRLNLLEIRARIATSHTAEVDAYLRESPQGAHNITNLSSSVVVQSEALIRQLESILGQKPDCGEGGCLSQLRWLDRPRTSEDFHKTATIMIPHLARIWKNSTYYMSYDAAKLAGLLAALEGRNGPLIAEALQQVKTLWEDTEFLNRHQRPDGRGEEERQSESLIHFVQVLGLSVAGDALLRKDMLWVHDMADHIVGHPEIFYFSHDHMIPPIFREVLRQRYPQLAQLPTGWRLPRWMERLFAEDRKSLPRLLEYLSDPELKSKRPDLIASFSGELRDLLHRHPDLKTPVEQFLSALPDAEVRAKIREVLAQ